MVRAKFVFLSLRGDSYQDKSKDAGESHVPHSERDGVREPKDSQDPFVVDDDCS